MKFDQVKNHRYIKLVEFALANHKFSVRQACDASGLTEDEFSGAKFSLFMLKEINEHIESVHEILDWRLKPEAYFSYVSYLEFKHSLATARRAWLFSAFSVLIAAASLFVATYGTFLK
jgi:hypothetical protein